MLNVEIISKEMIHPSSPTPQPLIIHELSLLDRIAPPIYIPMIFFYNAEQLTKHQCHRAYISQQLKKSLSDALVIFYPLAGRMKNPHYINCNDDGAEFIETEVNTNLSQVIENPDMKELKQFMPMDPCSGKGIELILAIQLNYFDCGGIAIGICISHKLVDGSSFVTFINSWAANSIGASNITKPNFGLAKHFPARDIPSHFESQIYESHIAGMNETIVTKRLLFDKNMLKALKASSSFLRSQIKDPTRVEVISTFIWRVLLKKANIKNNKKHSCLAHAVNLRRIMGESNFIGNLYKSSFVIVMVEQYYDDQDIVSQMRRAIKELDKDILKKLATGESYRERLESVKDMSQKGGIEFCCFSSWTRFPVYEANFGWGRPIWVCPMTMPIKNVVILMGTSNGEDIEAWVSLGVDDMDVLELAYKSLLLSSAI